MLFPSQGQPNPKKGRDGHKRVGEAPFRCRKGAVRVEWLLHSSEVLESTLRWKASRPKVSTCPKIYLTPSISQTFPIFSCLPSQATEQPTISSVFHCLLSLRKINQQSFYSNPQQHSLVSTSPFDYSDTSLHQASCPYTQATRIHHGFFH